MAPAPEKAMTKRRWNWSLGTLLLFLVIGVLAFSHITTSLQLAEARRELEKYRYEYGHLVVGDDSRPHLLEYAEQSNPWKWHVYLPEGKSYKMKCGIGKVPHQGLPNVADLNQVRETWVAGNGEIMTMTVSILDRDDDDLQISIGCDGSQTVRQIVPTKDVYTRTVYLRSSAGSGETFAPDPDTPFVLFYQVEHLPTAQASAGVVVWIEPIDADATP